MMKTITRLAAIIAVAAFSLACGSKEDNSVSIAGEWKLYSVAGVPVESMDEGYRTEVYINFVGDGTFEIFQKLGEGRYRLYTGTYAIAGTTVSGTYSDGKAWGSTYQASKEGSQLILTSQNANAEVCVYDSCTIPGSVRTEATIASKGSDTEDLRFL